MARERMVTRTIIESKVTALTVDTANGVCAEKIYTLTAVNDNGTALKMLKKLYDNDTTIIASVKSIEVNETLYGMPEVDFVKYAKPMVDYFHKPE